MKLNRLFSLLFLMVVAACHTPDAVAPNEDVVALHERFHGKYRPVQSTASEAVDLNFDGQSSVNLLSELADLPTTDLRIDINGPSQYQPTRSYVFYQMWPEQYVRNVYNNTEPTAYDSTVSVNYNGQGVPRPFTIDPTIKQIQIVPDKTPLPDPERFPLPEAVTIESGDRIRVVNNKRLFTRSGWRMVRVETIYERYTMVT